MKRDEPDEEPERWRDSDEDDEPRDWEVEPEEENEDKQPVLGGTEPVARFIFLVIVGCVLLGGVIALILALGDFFRG